MNDHTNPIARPFHVLLRCVLAALALGLALDAMPAEAQRRGGAQASATTTSEASADGVVNIQTASAEELMRLPGIGPSKAEAIIQFRDRTPFRRVEDILRVRGIGRATFRRLRPMITVSGPTTLAHDVTTRRAPRSEDVADEGAEEDAASE